MLLGGHLFLTARCAPPFAFRSHIRHHNRIVGIIGVLFVFMHTNHRCTDRPILISAPACTGWRLLPSVRYYRVHCHDELQMSVCQQTSASPLTIGRGRRTVQRLKNWLTSQNFMAQSISVGETFLMASRNKGLTILPQKTCG
jgi:hypothetical protein